MLRVSEIIAIDTKSVFAGKTSCTRHSLGHDDTLSTTSHGRHCSRLTSFGVEMNHFVTACRITYNVISIMIASALCKYFKNIPKAHRSYAPVGMENWLNFTTIDMIHSVLRAHVTNLWTQLYREYVFLNAYAAIQTGSVCGKQPTSSPVVVSV